MFEFARWLGATPLSVAVQSSSWLTPLLQAIHILMIGVVFVSVLMIALRVLGRVRAEQPMERVWCRFAPFLWGGLTVMALTGLLLTMAEPVREFMTLSFRIKLLLLATGITSAALFGRGVRRAVRAVGVASIPAAPFPFKVRLAAVMTVVLWLAIIFLGRAIAYDDSGWGEWSPAVLQRGEAT